MASGLGEEGEDAVATRSSSGGVESSEAARRQLAARARAHVRTGRPRDVARLRAAFFALKKDAAPGVDGETWRHYEQALETQSGDPRVRPVLDTLQPIHDCADRRPLGHEQQRDRDTGDEQDDDHPHELYDRALNNARLVLGHELLPSSLLTLTTLERGDSGWTAIAALEAFPFQPTCGHRHTLAHGRDRTGHDNGETLDRRTLDM